MRKLKRKKNSLSKLRTVVFSEKHNDVIFEALSAPHKCKNLQPKLPPKDSKEIIQALHCYHQGLYREALSVMSRSTEPRFKESGSMYYFMARCYFRLGRTADAQKYALAAFQRSDRYPAVAHLLGMIAYQQHKVEEAFTWYEKALKVDDDHLPTLTSFADALAGVGKNQQAVDIAKRVFEQCPRNQTAIHNYGTHLWKAGNFLQSAKILEKNLVPEVRLIESVSGYYYSKLFVDEKTLEADLPKHIGIGRQAAKQWPAQPFKPEHQHSERIRVGYLSGDLRRHSCAFFLHPIMSHHSEQIEVHCLSVTENVDDVTEMFQSVGVQFHQLASLNAAQLFEYVRGLKLDILVDTIGHTNYARLPLLLQRAAPVQINYLGFAQSTYLPTMDYRIVDEITDPDPGAFKGPETLLRTQGPFLSYQPILGMPAVAPAPFQENGYVTFGSFNNKTKISDACWRLWGQILDQVPGSRLVLKSLDMTGESKKRVLEAAQRNGVRSDIIEIKNGCPSYEAHMNTYNEIDISLDTFPYNGTTTTCESLVMGTPVVTLSGNTHISRVGSTIMKNVGIEELVSSCEESYVRSAVELACSPERIMFYNQGLRELFLNSSVCDGRRLTRELEELYGRILDASAQKNQLNLKAS